MGEDRFSRLEVNIFLPSHGMLELTGLSISLSFSQLGSDNTPAGEAIDYLFLLRARLVKKNRVL